MAVDEPVGIAATVARLLRERLATGPVSLKVDGRSMWPTIQPPAEVVVQGRARPGPGEVWAFITPDGAVVVHRYDRRIGRRYQFRGDGLDAADPLVDASVLVGRVTDVRDRNGARRLGWSDRTRGVVKINVFRLQRLVRRLLWSVRTMGSSR